MSRGDMSISEERFLSNKPTIQRGQPLTARELEVIALIVEGLTDAEIADRLCITPHTVQSHVSVALFKTRMRNRVQLAVASVRGNLESQL